MDPNQPPYQQGQYPPYPYPPQQPLKEPGVGAGFKMVLGGCLALLVITGGAFVACGVLVGGMGAVGSQTPGSSVESSSSAKTITLAQFNRLTDGMTYSQVVAVLGSDGKVSSESSYGGYTSKMYSWDAGFMKSVTVMFTNGKLTSKSQFGLD